MFSKLYITIKASDKFDDSIIDPIRAKLEINTENDNYQTYSITYQGMQTIMELCYECEFVMTIIDNDEKSESYTTYFSRENSNNFETDISELLE